METKTCTKCNLTKPLEEFHKSSRMAQGCQAWCKECNKKAVRKYANSTPGYIEQKSQRRKDISLQISNWKRERGCKICKESEPVCLDLHHLNPSEKDANPSSFSYSWKMFLKEAEKCVVLCANCHRKVHSGIIDLNIEPG